jgi:hypothetical protein
MQDFQLFLRNDSISRECSMKMISYLRKDILPTSRVGKYLEDGSIRFVDPSDTPCTCFRLLIGEEIEISVAIATDRMGNRAGHGEVYLNEGTQYKGNPSTAEILIMENPSSYDDDLDYQGDIRSFFREDCSQEGGFSDLVDELQRIHNIVFPSPEVSVSNN